MFPHGILLTAGLVWAKQRLRSFGPGCQCPHLEIRIDQRLARSRCPNGQMTRGARRLVRYTRISLTLPLRKMPVNVGSPLLRRHSIHQSQPGKLPEPGSYRIPVAILHRVGPRKRRARTCIQNSGWVPMIVKRYTREIQRILTTRTRNTSQIRVRCRSKVVAFRESI